MPAKPRWLLSISVAALAFDTPKESFHVGSGKQGPVGVLELANGVGMQTFGAELLDNQRTLRGRTKLLQQLKKRLTARLVVTWSKRAGSSSVGRWAYERPAVLDQLALGGVRRVLREGRRRACPRRSSHLRTCSSLAPAPAAMSTVTVPAASGVNPRHLRPASS